MRNNASLVPKLHLGTFLDPREILFRAGLAWRGLGDEVARTSAFPSATWEQGKRWIYCAAFLLITSFLLTSLAKAFPPPALQSVTFRGQSYFVRTVDPKQEDVRIFRKDDHSGGFLDFPDVELKANAEGIAENLYLTFAANAGMFEADGKPVGLLVQKGNETSPLNLNDATGNFYMKPNGVFLINEKREAMVVESSSYQSLLTPVVWATQSGPMLVHAGSIHPDFIEDSKNLNIRSGVGVRKDGMIVFAISRGPVNFYNFAELFSSRLKCPNALYLDGTISAFYVPDHSKATETEPKVFHQFGPIIGVMDSTNQSMTPPTTKEEQALLKSLGATNSAPAAPH